LPDLLAARLCVVTFDCQGLGASERRDEPFTIHAEMQDIEVVLAAVGLATVHVYGRSRGGALAQEFALSCPRRVRSLVLCGATHFGPGRVGDTPDVEKAMNFTPDRSREEIFATQNMAMAAPGWRGRAPEAFTWRGQLVFVILLFPERLQGRLHR
jgi:pimeloyl-ACP methyl ester carboxylesterase